MTCAYALDEPDDPCPQRSGRLSFARERGDTNLAGVARYVLVPIGNAIAWAVERLLRPPLVFLIRYLVIKPGALLYRYVLAPVGRYVLAPIVYALIGALLFAGSVSTVVFDFLIVRPLSWLWRAVLVPIRNHVLAPIGRAIRATLRPIGNATREILRAFRIGGRAVPPGR
ncbi:hypothetical protein ABT354_25495 [Streptomyces sp. NPDC000594]|uniref:hypothetical protein n=1 Tax=Streptomyces sp. NPDC000594 TaxID=3154261 RepID=UPI00331B7808